MQWNKKTWILDGPIGTRLQDKGLKVGEIPEELSITKPNIVSEIHQEYVDSGAEIIYTNTFGANRYKLKDSKYTIEEIVKASIFIAKNTAKDKALVALGMGPIGKLLEPNGDLTFEEAYDIFKEIILIGVAENVNLIVFETLSDIYEAKAGILAAKENSNLPIFVTMSLEQNGRTFLGSSLDEIVPLLEGLGVDALGINCSLGPAEIKSYAIKLTELTSLPIIIKPNAGLPDPLTNKYNSSPEEFSDILVELYSYGVTMFGGCCGSNPDYISLLSQKLKNKPIIKKDIINKSVITSGTKTVAIENVTVIGERLSSTGKLSLQNAIRNKNTDYIIKEVLDQINEGADIVNINLSLPEFNETEYIPHVIKAIQSITNTPLQIDTTKPKTLDAALRVYNGKAIANSVSGKKSSLEKVLPIVKKYGASVIALTLDDDGIPETAEGRLEVARKILKVALSYGIKKEDIFIDTLVLTASAQQKDVFETLKAIKLIKEELGMKTILGVSNISYGLPNRDLLNESFLTMALYSGLDLAIVNFGKKNIVDNINAYRVLANIDKESKNYISFYNQNDHTKKIEVNTTNKELTLQEAIIQGYKNDSKLLTTELLKTENELDVINNHLIAALDFVGKGFEKEEIFLPQLLQSANCVKASFTIIREKMLKEGKETKSNGKVLLATVKGDIHDIGKNIVKTILENYNYEVVDLGKDVPIEKVVDAVIKDDIKLVGLSALMTTTLDNMKLTINAIKKVKPNCKIVVGGAVLTDEYSKLINADYYAKDAISIIDIAKEIFV